EAPAPHREAGDVAAGLPGEDLEPSAEGGEASRRQAGGMPAVAVVEGPAEHPVDELRRSVAVGGAGEIDGRPLLDRLRPGRDVLEAMELAGDGDVVLGPQPPDDGERLEKPRHPLAALQPVGTHLAVVAPADADRQLHPPSAQDVEAGPLDGEQDGVAQVEGGEALVV